MNIQQIEKIDAVGFLVRTTNENEQDQSTSKISPLWKKFFTEALPQLTPESKVFGVYTNYETDHTGAFDVIACTDCMFKESPADLVDIQIEAGKYLTFSKKGPMPQAVIELWGEVWMYFNIGECEHKRRFTTDFEFYRGIDEVEISIAIE